MKWTRREFCLLKLNVKWTLFQICALGLLCFALSFAFFEFHYYSRMTAREPRENTVRYTMQISHSIKVQKNQSSPWDKLKGIILPHPVPVLYSSSTQQEQLFQGTKVGLDTSLMDNSILTEQTSVGEPLNDPPYRYLINEPDKCQSITPFVVMLITVEPAELSARNAIRQTWGNERIAPGLGFVRLFLIGQGNATAGHLQQSIKEESLIHHDIIEQDYQDTYRNLTIKTLMGMYWVANYCPHARYVMKTDSDMFVNTEYLIFKLLRPDLLPKQNYFTGYIMRGSVPIRNKNSKWYMPPELYQSKQFPVFCSGTGYVFSGDLAAKIYNVSLSIRLLPLEDVYVGICLAKLHIDPVPPPNQFLFNNWLVSYSSCRYSHLITSHQFKPNALIMYWDHFQKNKHKACR